MTVAEHCNRVGVVVVLEWPERCEYLDEPVVVDVRTRLGVEFIEFDGCVYGRMSTFTGVVTFAYTSPMETGVHHL